MKASDLFVKCLEAEGLELIFGVPGEENADLMMSLEDSEIRFILTRHEQGAAFMAAVYGRLSGELAACLGTLGPGATNLVTGVADGNMDHAPMLVLTGQGSTERLHKESHQIMDVVALYRPVTKWAHQLSNADTIPEVLRKAVRVARAEKPGAVLVELPEDVAKHESEASPMAVRRFRRPMPDDVAVEAAAKALATAKRPIIIAGNGAVRKRSSDSLRKLVERTGIGSACTFMGKGSVSREAEECLFTIGLQSRDHVHCAVEAADLVMTVGYDMVEYPPRLWNEASDKTILHLDFEAAEIDQHYNPQHELVGDISHSLDRLAAALEEAGPRSYDLSSQRKARAAMLREFREHAEDTASGALKPQKILHDLQAAMGPQDVLLSGVGAHKMWIARHFQCVEPNTCIVPNGFCSMGLPLPGLVGAKLARPEARVVGIAGDGDFLMNVQEMETIRRLDLDVTLMVWEDGGYGLIGWKQHNEFGHHTDLSFGNPDWKQLAAAFGWSGEICADSSELSGAIERAFAHRGPSLLVVPVDYRENLKLSERLGQLTCPI